FFKARAGFDGTGTPLNQSVCVHAIKEREILVVPDLSLDPRTRDNPLVVGPPHIRFYAGAVLRTRSGEALGALCVIDTVPRPQGLSDEQASGLLALARQTMILLRHRRDEAVEGAQQAGGIGTFEIDLTSDRLFPSAGFCRIYGLPGEHSFSIGEVHAMVLPGDPPGSTLESRKDGSAPREVQFRIRRANDGEVRWISRRADFERDPQGRTVRMLGAVQDITERKHLEAVQQTLNEELSHRLKNTLAMVDAIAQQTLRNAADMPAVATFGRRIQALGRAHDVLLGRAMVGGAVRTTVEAVVGMAADLARFDLDGPNIDINPRSVLSFSLLIHELVTNAVKYGALSNDKGRVVVRWRTERAATGQDEFVFDWREEGGPPVIAPARRGFGSRLIASGLSGTGTADVRYEREGMRALFRAPLAFVSG
ncbi:MAG TPA: HWE histidine kinase domain-containing protein, partial [Burkholderiaceae bacterium]|nr:HWE histidine kinase domain-containing protein [Burkholderiaceae bacterium]